MKINLFSNGNKFSCIIFDADRDSNITVLSDCCYDRDEDVHRVLTTKVFPRQADVITSEGWTQQLPK